MKTLRILAFICLAAVLGFGQNPNGTPPVGVFSQVQLPLLTSLPPVTQANVALVGNPGPGTYYYWLVTNYTFGQTSPQGPFPIFNAPVVLSGSNYVTITPGYLPGGTVDVLRTTSLTPPSGTGNFAVSTGNTSGTISDQGGALSSYTVNPVSPDNFGICLSNQVVSSGKSHLILSQGPECTFVADLSIVGTSAGTVTSITATLPVVVTPSPLTTTGVVSLANSGVGAGSYTSANITVNAFGLVTAAANGSGGGGITGSGTAGHAAGFTGSTAIGDTPCTFTSSSFFCNMVATSPSGTNLFELSGGSGGSAFYFQDTTGYSIRDNWLSSGTSGLEPGINIGVSVSGAPNNSGLHVWGNAAELLELNQISATFGSAVPVTITAAGAASNPALTFSGAPFTGGSGTTTYPLIYTEGGTPPTTWSTSGTVLGMNQAPGFVGNYLDLRTNGAASAFAVNYLGEVTIGGCAGGTYVKADGTGCGTPAGGSGTTVPGGPVYGGTTAGSTIGELFKIDVGPNSTCGGLCNASDPEDTKIHDVMAATWSAGTAPEMDGTGYTTGSIQVWNTNPWNGINKSFVFHQGLYVIDQCVPIVTPTVEFTWDGLLESQSSGGVLNSVIRAAPVNECTGNAAFPNGTNTTTWTYHHGPYPAATIVAQIYDGGMVTSGTGPTWVTNTFGHTWKNLSLNANCEANFGILSGSDEEHTLIHNLIVENYGTGTTSIAGQIFYDRESNQNISTQSGPGNGSFEMIQGPPCPTQSAGVAHGIVIEGANVVVDLTGGGGSGATAYVSAITSTAVSSIALGNVGTGYTSNPTCSIYAANGTGATCTATQSGGAVTGVTLTAGGSGYNTGALVVGGPLKITGDTGIASTNPAMADFIWDEGTTGADIGPNQFQQAQNTAIQYGAGGALTIGGFIHGVTTANETGSATASVTIGPGGDNNVKIVNVCKNQGNTHPIIVDTLNNYTITAAVGAECVPDYSPLIQFPAGSVTHPSINFAAGGIYASGGLVAIEGSGTAVIAFKALGPILPNGLDYLWSSTGLLTGAPDTGLGRSSAGIVTFDTGNGSTPGNGLGGLIATEGVREIWTNDTSGAHPIGNFAVIGNAANPLAVRNALTTSTGGVVGVCISGCAASGTSIVARSGQVTAQFDAGTTAGDLVQISSTTAGNLHDSGASTCPANASQVLGVVLSSNVGAGAYTVELKDGLCGATGGASGTTNNAAQFSIATYINSGSSNTLGGLTAPTSPNGVPQVPTSTPAGGAATAYVNSLPGIVGRAVSGTTSTDTILSTDCNPQRVEYVGSVSVAVTLPTATTLAVPNCTTKLVNTTTGSSTTVVITPTTWTINGSSTLTLAIGQSAVLFVDPNSATNWAADVSGNATSGTVTSVASGAGLTGGTITGSGTLSVTGGAGQILAGATPSLTSTPTLGASGTLGSITFGNASSGTLTMEPLNAALGTITGDFVWITAAPTSNNMPKFSGVLGAMAGSLLSDSGTVLSYTGTGGFATPVIILSGTTAGFIDLPQGSTSAAVSPCSTANSICIQAPTSVTAQLRNLASTPASGFSKWSNSAGTMNETIAAIGGSLTSGVGLLGTFAINSVVASTVANVAGHFTNLQVVTSLFTTCGTLPIFNVFDGTTNTGSTVTATASTQTKGGGTSTAQTLTFAAGDIIGIYISTAGATCTTDEFTVTAQYAIP